MGIKAKIGSILHRIIMMTKEEKIKPIIVPVDKEKLLDGKVALITGGSSGIGFAIARAFLNSGAKVIIAGTNEEKLKKALSTLKTDSNSVNQGTNDSENDKVRSLVLNVRDTQSLPAKVEEAAFLFSENRIDILVNSAGVLNKHDFWNMTEEEYDSVMETNARGTYFMSQAVGKHMIEKKVTGGHILNVTSSSALRPAWTPYQLSKWAIKGLTLGLSDLLLPYGIVVNAIAPGPTATPMQGKSNQGCENIYQPCTPAGRYAMPEELASLAVYMVSGAGEMIVGDTVYMTGGSGVITLQD